MIEKEDTIHGQADVEPLESPAKVLSKKSAIQNSYSTNALMPNKIQTGQVAYANVSQVSADEVKKPIEPMKMVGKARAFESDKMSVDSTPKVTELVKAKGHYFR